MAAEEDRDDQYEEEVDTGEEEQQTISKEEYDKLVEQLNKVSKAHDKAKKEAAQRRHKLNDYQERLQKYELDPDDPEKLEEALDTYKRTAEKSDKGEQPDQKELEKLKKQFEEEKKKEVQQYEDKLQKMQGTVEKYLVESNAASAIQEFDGVPKLLMPHIKQNVSVQQTDTGEYAVRVLDEDGDPRFNKEGDYMGIRDLVAEMRESEDFGMAFKAKAPSGTGSDPSSKKGGEKGAPKNMSRSQMTNNQKEEYIKKHGSDEYFKLPLWS